MDTPEATTSARPRTDAAGIGGYLRSRKVLILAIAVATVSALAVLAVGRVPSEPRSPRAGFAERIEPLGTRGDFTAVTANIGERAGRATCRVTAFDIYGSAIGSKVFALGRVEVGGRVGWRGHVRVEGKAERMRIDCR